MKKIIIFMIIAALCGAGNANVFAESRFSDVPSGSWAEDYIEKAAEYGLMQGNDDGAFGYGNNVTRGEFAAVMSRMMKWKSQSGADMFDDISSHWAREYANCAAEYDAADEGGNFYPDKPLSRGEMAEFSVRSFGLRDAAGKAENQNVPFADVTARQGYIKIARDMEIVNGMSDTEFSPDGNMTREQCAAVLVRIYEKIYPTDTFVHGFYAISSYSQIGYAENADAVSLGWARMCYDGANGAYICTTYENGNEYAFPDGYEGVVSRLHDRGVKLNLSVYADCSAAEGERISDLLKNTDARNAAVSAIIEILDEQEKIGNRFDGVTIDFEGLRGEEQKENFSAFLTLLKTRLDEKGRLLYTAVMPQTADGIYYGGYDFGKIGELSDKIILMAHDYNAKSLEGFEGTQYYKNTALTPMSAVYYSLKAACGETDSSKIMLAFSFSDIAWQTDENGMLTSKDPIYPSLDTVKKRLAENLSGAGYSKTYRNPYLEYKTADGQNIFLWYENERSISEKMAVARMFGVNSFSVWRFGIIPDSQNESLEFNAAKTLGLSR